MQKCIKLWLHGRGSCRRGDYEALVFFTERLGRSNRKFSVPDFRICRFFPVSVFVDFHKKITIFRLKKSSKIQIFLHLNIQLRMTEFKIIKSTFLSLFLRLYYISQNFLKLPFMPFYSLLLPIFSYPYSAFAFFVISP